MSFIDDISSFVSRATSRVGTGSGPDVYPSGPEGPLCVRDTAANSSVFSMLGCTRTGASCQGGGGDCSDADIAEGVCPQRPVSVSGQYWNCPQDVYDYAWGLFQNQRIPFGIASISDYRPALEAVAARQQAAQGTRVASTTKPSVQSVFENAVYSGVTDVVSKTGQVSYTDRSTTTPTSTSPTINTASIVPEGWGWPIAIGGVVLILGTAGLLWYKNRRGL